MYPSHLHSSGHNCTTGTPASAKIWGKIDMQVAAGKVAGWGNTGVCIRNRTPILHLNPLLTFKTWTAVFAMCVAAADADKAKHWVPVFDRLLDVGIIFSSRVTHMSRLRSPYANLVRNQVLLAVRQAVTSSPYHQRAVQCAPTPKGSSGHTQFLVWFSYHQPSLGCPDRRTRDSEFGPTCGLPACLLSAVAC